MLIGGGGKEPAEPATLPLQGVGVSRSVDWVIREALETASRSIKRQQIAPSRRPNVSVASGARLSNCRHTYTSTQEKQQPRTKSIFPLKELPGSFPDWSSSSGGKLKYPSHPNKNMFIIKQKGQGGGGQARASRLLRFIHSFFSWFCMLALLCFGFFVRRVAGFFWSAVQ